MLCLERPAGIAAEQAGFGNRETARQAKAGVVKSTRELVQAMDEGRVSISNATASTKLPEDVQLSALGTEEPNKSLREAVLAVASMRPQVSSNRKPI
ncbi:hypothetical protein [Ochrobactrum sp. EDr1-4]|uniref:hypothetical protein n=1 Tax=Ochrobactrum sp. EDr1-4 TaxID=3368622 RepID=UPI003BA07C03